MSLENLTELLDKYKTSLAEKNTMSPQLFPATPQQKAIWAIEQYQDKHSLYLARRFVVTGHFAANELEKLCLTIIHEEPILRTVFTYKNGVLYQYVSSDFNFSVTHKVFENNAEVTSYWNFFREQKANLFQGPLWEIALIDCVGEQQLFFKLHHIIGDAYSAHYFIKRLAEIAEGVPPKKHKSTYFDYAKELNSKKSLLEKKSYEVLNSVIAREPLVLPFAHDAANNISLKRYAFKWNNNLILSLRRLARESSATLSALYLAAWSMLLARISGQNKFAISMNYHGRYDKSYAQTLGVFTTLLPLLIDYDDMPIAAFFKKICSLQSEAENKAISIDMLLELAEKQEELNVLQRVSSIDFNIILGNTSKFKIASHMLTAIAEEELIDAISLGLQLLPQSDESLVLSLVYDANAYCEKHITYIAELLTSIVKELPIAQSTGDILTQNLPVLPSYTPHPTIVELIARQVEKSPDSVALIHGNFCVTYRELWDKATIWAERLWQLGARPQGLVVTFRAVDIEQVAIILAIWRLGAYYLPLDFYNQRPLLAELDFLGEPFVLINNEDVLPNITTYTHEENWPKPSDKAYLIYTSGSTGKPKAAINTHMGLSAQIIGKCERLGLTGQDNMAFSSSLAFDVTFFQLFSELTIGGRVTILEHATPIFDPNALLSEIITYAVTVLPLVPSQLEILCIRGSHELWQKIKLKILILSGERFPTYLAKKWRNLYHHGVIWNFYGVTECSDDVSAQLIDENILTNWRHDTLPAGTPFRDAYVDVVDNCHRLLKPLCPGEILIRGPFVGLGYQNDPQRTALSFKKEGYYTGDIGYKDLDGNLVYMGRGDSLVKFRGYRVELAEIERALQNQEGVFLAAVSLVKYGNEQFIRAHLVPQNGIKLNATVIIKGLLTVLPNYMLPKELISCPTLPYLPSGKLDRQALATWPGEKLAIASGRAPQGEVEKKLADIFKEILHLDSEIDAEASFLELGGSSLSMLELKNRLAESFGYEVPINSLFNENSIALLGSLITSGSLKKHLTIKHEEREKAPAPMGELRLFTLEQTGKLADLILRVTIELPRGLGADELQNIISKLLERHPILDAHFVLEGGELWLKKGHFTSADILRPHKLEPLQGPLWQVEQFSQDGKELLTLAIHHIITDNYSQNILGEEVSVLLKGEKLPPVSPTAFDYFDFAAWQKEWLAGQDIKLLAQKTANKAIQVAPLVLPEEYCGQGENGNYYFVFQPQLVRILEIYAQNKQITMAQLLLALWGLFLRLICGSENFAITTLLSGREILGANSLMGYFVNSFPLFFINVRPILSEILPSAKEELEGALANELIPFEYLSANLPEQTTPLSSFTNVGFNVLSYAEIPLEITSGGHNTYFDLGLNIVINGHKIGANLEYSHRCYRDTTAAYLAELFIKVAQKALEEPENVISLADFAPIDLPALISPAPPLLPQKLAESGKNNAAQIAITASGKELTYQGLAAAALALAAQLSTYGVKAGDIVFTMLPRSAYYPAALMAIWQIGAIYWPLDINNDEPRLKTLWEDVSGAWLLAENIQPYIAKERAIVPDYSYSGALPEYVTSPKDIAYIISTSGSTGRPKGAMNYHEGLARHVSAKIASLGLGSGDRVLATAAFSFDVSLWQMLAPLAVGGQLYISQKTTPVFDLAGLIEELLSYEIDYLELVPSQLEMLVKYLNTLEKKPELKLKKLLLVGQILYKNLAESWLNIYPKIPLLNVYGPSECADNVAECLIEQKLLTSWNNNILPIGKPLPGCHLAIVDEEMRPLPPLCPGELLICGPFVGAGYYNNPSLTANSFGTYNNLPCYHTGDLAVKTLAGDFVCLGRKDSQIKLRGYRLELGEIESHLREIKGILAAAVIASETGAAMQLKAYIVAEEGSKPSRQVIVRELGQVVPYYMIPQEFYLVKSLPYLPSGKLNRRALATLRGELLSGSGGRKPKGEVEEKIATVINDILKTDEEIDAEAPLFSLGVDSFILLTLFTRLESVFGHHLPARLFAPDTTIVALADNISELSNVGGEILPLASYRLLDEADYQLIRNFYHTLPLKEKLLFPQPLRENGKSLISKARYLELLNKNQLLLLAVLDQAGELIGFSSYAENAPQIAVKEGVWATHPPTLQDFHYLIPKWRGHILKLPDFVEFLRQNGVDNVKAAGRPHSTGLIVKPEIHRYQARLIAASMTSDGRAEEELYKALLREESWALKEAAGFPAEISWQKRYLHLVKGNNFAARPIEEFISVHGDSESLLALKPLINPHYLFTFTAARERVMRGEQEYVGLSFFHFEPLFLGAINL